MNYQKYFIKNKPLKLKGFTLVETLVAITILIIGVLGPMMSATRGITDGLYAQNQLIGTHLAQEGLELLGTQIESNNILNHGDANGDGDTDSDDFLFDLGACVSSPYCGVIVESDGLSVNFSFPSCPSSSNCDIAFDSIAGFYKQYISGNQMKFKRTLSVTTLTAKEVLLKSTVTWTNKSILQTVTLYRYAFDRN